MVPAGDHLTGAEAELERVATVPAGIELLAGAPGHADVVDVDRHSGRGLGTVALDQIFDKYRTNPKESPNELDIEGTGRLLEDLGIELDNCAALYFFEFTKSPQLGVITREGFTSGPLVDAGCDTPDKIRKHIYDQLITNNGTLEQYKAVYNHTFTLLIEDRKKAIDLEQAEVGERGRPA